MYPEVCSLYTCSFRQDIWKLSAAYLAWFPGSRSEPLWLLRWSRRSSSETSLCDAWTSSSHSEQMESPAETDSTEAVNQCRLAQEPLQGFFLLNKDNVVHNNLICQEDVEPWSDELCTASKATAPSSSQLIISIIHISAVKRRYCFQTVMTAIIFLFQHVNII